MIDENPSHWTPDFVLKHVLAMLASNDRRYEERFAAQEKAVKDALAAQEKAVNAALAAAEKAVLVAENNAQDWRRGANEWRQAMTDREAKFVGFMDFTNLKERIDRTEGGGTRMREIYAWLVAGIVAVAAVVSALWQR